MDHLEEQYKKGFQNQELSNQGFDVEGLWDDIARDLDTPPRNKPYGRWMFVFIPLLMIIGTLYFFLTDGENTIPTPSITQSIEMEASEDQDTPSTPLDQASVLSSVRSNPSAQKIQNDQNIIQSPSPIDQVEFPSNASKPVTPYRSEIERTNPTDLNITEKGTPPSLPSFSENVDPSQRSSALPLASEERQEKQQKEQSGLDPLEEEKILTKQVFNSLKPIQRPALTIVETAHRTLHFNLPPFTPDRNPRKQSHKKVSTQIGLWGGFNRLRLNYIAEGLPDVEPLKNETEKGEYGVSVGVQAAILWKNRLRFHTGFEYHQLNTSFEYE